MDDSYIEPKKMSNIKKSFNAMMSAGDDSFSFGTTRHNLLADFEDTPVKSSDVGLEWSLSKKRRREEEGVGLALSHGKNGGKEGGKGVSKTVSNSFQNDCFHEREIKNLMEAEIISLKSKITKLQDRLSSEELASRKARIEHEDEVFKLQSESKQNFVKMNELDSKMSFVKDQERMAKDKIIELERNAAHQKLNYESRLEMVQKEKREVEDKAQMQREKWHETESTLHDTIIQQKKEIIQLQSVYGEAQAQLALRDRRREEDVAALQDVDQLRAQLKASQDKVQSLEKEISDHADNMMVTKALKADLDLMPKMKNDLERLTLDNEELRSNEQNCLLLEEEVRSLKFRLGTLEKENKRIVELEVANEELEDRLHRWEAHDESGSRRPQSPSSLSKRVKELEMIQATLKLKEGELQTEANSANFRLQQVEGEKQKLCAELEVDRNTILQNTDLIKRLRRKVLLLSKERDSNRKILESYESEVTVNIDAQRSAHTQRQEDMLADYRREVEELEAEVTRITDLNSELKKKLFTVQQQLQGYTSADNSSLFRHEKEQELRREKEQVAELQIELAQVQRQKDILEARIEQRHLQGDYDPSKTKVLHFSMNPAAVAQRVREESMEALQTEVETLRKRNQILEEQGGGQVADLTVQVEEKMAQPSPSKELEEMKAQLGREEMRNKRLKEVFKKMSQELREVCYQLTGYRIDIPYSNQYRLSNMYAESAKDHLLFQQKDGEIQLLETDYSQTLHEAMETYLKTQHSIPAFLSSITLNLFSQQTMIS